MELYDLFFTELRRALQAGIASLRKLLDRFRGRNHEGRESTDRDTSDIPRPDSPEMPRPPREPPKSQTSISEPPRTEAAESTSARPARPITSEVPAPAYLPAFPIQRMQAPLMARMSPQESMVDEGRPDVRIGGVKTFGGAIRPPTRPK